MIASAASFHPGRGDAVAWMLGIAAHLSASGSRRAAREREARERLAGRRVLDEDDVQRLEDRIDAEAAAPELLEALASLPAGERAVLELVAVDGLSPRDAAAVLGVGAAAARMRLARARRKLRAVLRSEEEASSFVAVEEVTR